MSETIRDIIDKSKSSSHREGNLWIKRTGKITGVFVNNGTSLICDDTREIYTCLAQHNKSISAYNIVFNSPRRLWLFARHNSWDLDKLNLSLLSTQFAGYYHTYSVDHYLFTDGLIVDTTTTLNTMQDMKLFPNGAVIRGTYFAPVGGNTDEIIHKNKIVMAAYNLVTHSMVRLRASHGIKIKGQFFVYGVLRFNGVAVNDFGSNIHIAMPLYGSYYTG